MIEVVALKPEHVWELKKKSALSYAAECLTDEHVERLVGSKCSSAAIRMATGEVIACAGIIEWWKDRGEMWAFFDKCLQKEFVAIHRTALRMIQVAPFKRLEAIVDCNFEEGHRWVKMLGFQVEAPRMKSYSVDGRDMTLYARVGG